MNAKNGTLYECRFFCYAERPMNRFSILLLLLGLSALGWAKNDHYGIPIPENITTSNIDELFNDTEEKLADFSETLKFWGYTQELFLKGTFDQKKTYVVIGLLPTYGIVKEALETAQKESEEMILNSGVNLYTSFIKIPVTTWHKICDDVGEDLKDAKDIFDTHCELGLGHYLLAIMGGAYFLILEVPWDTAYNIVSGVVQSTYHLVKNPGAGTWALAAGSVVGTYGIASSVVFSTIPGAVTLVLATTEGLKFILLSGPLSLRTHVKQSHR